MLHLRRLGPALLRHLESYGQLAGAALRDTGDSIRSRATLVACGLVLAVAFLVLAGATAIAAAWATPYQWWTAAAVLGSMACGAALCLSRANLAIPRSPHLQALGDEWRKDKDWLARGTDAIPVAGARAQTAS